MKDYRRPPLKKLSQTTVMTTPVDFMRECLFPNIILTAQNNSQLTTFILICVPHMVIKPNQMLSALKVEFLPKLLSLPDNQYYIKSLIKCNESVNLLVAHYALCSFQLCSLMTWNVKVKSLNTTSTRANLWGQKRGCHPYWPGQYLQRPLTAFEGS